MCQEENVVAIATLTPEYGKIVYKGGDGKMNTKEIKIVKNTNNSEYYGGRLELDSHLVNTLNGSRIDNFTIGSYTGKLIFNNNKGYLYPREQCVVPSTSPRSNNRGCYTDTLAISGQFIEFGDDNKLKFNANYQFHKNKHPIISIVLKK